VGIYAYTRDALAQWVALPVSPLEQIERLEQLRPLAAGIPIGVGITADPGLPGIDTEDDLRRANDAWPLMTHQTPTPISTPPVPAGTR
jgi:3-deoxy-manno-octulosonate cytidylyltransferase (CMP-KDO synthetase)